MASSSNRHVAVSRSVLLLAYSNNIAHTTFCAPRVEGLLSRQKGQHPEFGVTFVILQLLTLVVAHTAWRDEDERRAKTL
jgi:hypothetical protein